MARIAGVNIPDRKHVWVSLTSIFGVGKTRAFEICGDAGVDPYTQVINLPENELDNLRTSVGKFVVEGESDVKLQ